MNKKYRLLKDLPGIKAGVMVYGSTPFTFCPLGGGKCFTFGEDEMINNPDWFEEVKEEKPEKIKKGTVMVSKNQANVRVVYTGKGKKENDFSGVVIHPGPESIFPLHKFSRTWNLSGFKPAQ